MEKIDNILENHSNKSTSPTTITSNEQLITNYHYYQKY